MTRLGPKTAAFARILTSQIRGRRCAKTSQAACGPGIMESFIVAAGQVSPAAAGGRFGAPAFDAAS
jgi:hypothetical protein